MQTINSFLLGLTLNPFNPKPTFYTLVKGLVIFNETSFQLLEKIILCVFHPSVVIKFEIYV